MKTEGLRVLTTVPAAPTTLYLAWLSSEQHANMTSGTAKIEPVVGSDYSALGGYITGKLVVLDLGRRIVMSWRTTDFPREAPDSKVELFLEAMGVGASSRVTVLHQGIPEGQGAQYKSLWTDKYFTPMRAFFSKFLPDPRDPPPPRRPIPPPDEDDEEEEIEEPKAKAGKAAKPEPRLEPKKVAPAKAAPAPEPRKPEPAKPEPRKAEPRKAAKPEPTKAAPATAQRAGKTSAPAKAAPAKAPRPPAKPEPKKAAPAKKAAKAPQRPAGKAAPAKAAKKPVPKPAKKKKK